MHASHCKWRTMPYWQTLFDEILENKAVTIFMRLKTIVQHFQVAVGALDSPDARPPLKGFPPSRGRFGIFFFVETHNKTSLHRKESATPANPVNSHRARHWQCAEAADAWGSLQQQQAIGCRPATGCHVIWPPCGTHGITRCGMLSQPSHAVPAIT